MSTRDMRSELHEMRSELHVVIRVAQKLERGCERIIERIETQPQDDPADMIDQHKSSLSARRHCAAVRRRRAEGKPGAYISGRRYLLTRKAYIEELARESEARPGLASCAPDNEQEQEEESAYRELVTRMKR